MPRKNPGAWKRLSGGKAGAKKKPHLEWRVVAATALNLQEELQALTDAKWRVFAVVPFQSEFLISAYLSAWGASEGADESGDK